MIGLHTADLVQSVEHGGNIAVAAKQLGILFDGLPVQQGQNAMEAIAAAGADDALDGRIGKGGVDVGGANGVGTRQKAVSGGGAGIEHGLQAHITDGAGQLFGGLGRGAGTAQDGHAVTGLKVFGTDHRRFLQSKLLKKGSPEGLPFGVGTYLLAIAALNSSIIMGTTLNRSPTMP